MCSPGVKAARRAVPGSDRIVAQRVPRKSSAQELLLTRAEGLGAIRARANAAEMIVAVNSSGVAVAENDLNRVIAYARGRLRAHLGFEHGQHRCGSASGSRERAFFHPFFIARRARALIA